MSAETVVVKAAGIRAVFERENQRWVHRIELTNNSSGYELVMRSSEGAADAIWPPSPVIQELEVQVHEGAMSMMGLGMSGQTHWSLSCRAAPHPVSRWAGSECLIFEAACRLRGAFERVGTCYRVVPEISATEIDQGIIYKCGIGQWCAMANHATISNANQTLRIDVFDDETDAAPRTVQWVYAINRIRE